jgi:hypothetical protein
LATRATRRANNRTARQEALEHEAAELIAARIAEGRPPPEVWAAAARKQARRGPVKGGWYTPTPPFPPAPVATAQPTEHAPLVLRAVRLPVASS